ncbi:hypothetical protein ABL78_8375 [Leptomonas seymouri]|uniref:Transmembrane protein n=1 Tax=Leptomonas seymouri TaxID=5684 RepID=A0A0N1HZ91_LEPSE|nr:hypothetical protein ABL78_8375 [Leptomonas seymouri]|eukprot:KPI82615.1 hypothetical protein ABL78_8375 [Leptomonas seymouri]
MNMKKQREEKKASMFNNNRGKPKQSSGVFSTVTLFPYVTHTQKRSFFVVTVALFSFFFFCETFFARTCAHFYREKMCAVAAFLDALRLSHQSTKKLSKQQKHHQHKKKTIFKKKKKIEYMEKRRAQFSRKTLAGIKLRRSELKKKKGGLGWISCPQGTKGGKKEKEEKKKEPYSIVRFIISHHRFFSVLQSIMRNESGRPTCNKAGRK